MDIVVVLGHQLRSGSIHPELRGRVDAGVDAFRSTDASYLLFSGGTTSPVVSTPEAEVMREYANELGIDPIRIILETRAEDTVGNGYFTRRIVDEMSRDVDTIYLVTSRYHAESAAYVFRQCFGDECAIDVSRCHNDPTSRNTHSHDHEKMLQLREFFEPIDPGDVAAIRQRLVESHDYYPELELSATTP